MQSVLVLSHDLKTDHGMIRRLHTRMDSNMCAC